MLQSLGISAEAEALYLVLAPLSSARSSELAELTGDRPRRGAAAPSSELRKLGLAAASGADAGRPLPLLDAVHTLKAQRCRDRRRPAPRPSRCRATCWPPRAPSEDNIKC